MYTIPLLSTSAKLHEQLRALLETGAPGLYELLLLTNTRAAERFLTIEMPELIFINFSDTKINAFQLIETMLKDPWLLHGGIIALCKEHATVGRINELRGANVLVSLTYRDLERQLPGILEIIQTNRRILFQRGIGRDIVGALSGSFRLHNNLFEVTCYLNLICNFLYNANKLSLERKYFFHLALYEMLMNAVEHGNCGITYDEKSRFLERGGFMPDLIERRCKDPAIAAKTVTFDYTIHLSHARFVIADEGDGFDWRAMLETVDKKDTLRLNGRGIIITQKTVRCLRYNEKGNEVTVEIDYETDGGAITPALFNHIEPLDVKQGDTVISQGDSSTFLYFIVKGRYEILVNDACLSSLSADDIFMGEMSFLLNDRRSATVRAATDGKLIKITKEDFVKAIKKRPHYALFLARLLAERIQRLNAASAEKSRLPA